MLPSALRKKRIDSTGRRPVGPVMTVVQRHHQPGDKHVNTAVASASIMQNHGDTNAARVAKDAADTGTTRQLLRVRRQTSQMQVLAPEPTKATRASASSAPISKRTGIPSSVLARAEKAIHGRSEIASLFMNENHRYRGGCCPDITKDFINACTVASSNGRPTNLNFHFRFLQRVPALLVDFGKVLRQIDLSCNNISCIENMESLSNLRILKLCACQLSKIEGLDTCYSMVALYLQDNNLSSISGLEQLQHLEYLNLDSNNIHEIGIGLNRLSKLKELYLSWNRLSTLNGFSNLGSLQTLCVNRNFICEILPVQVSSLLKLDELQLAGNQLDNLEFLVRKGINDRATLPKLASLNMSGNALTTASLEHMPVLSRLHEFDISSNQIYEIPEVVEAKLPVLEIIDVSNNFLNNIGQLERFKKIRSLKELRVQGNPCPELQDSASMRLAAGLFPSLECFDDKRVSRAAEEDISGMGQNPELDDTGAFRLTAPRLPHPARRELQHSLTDPALLVQLRPLNRFDLPLERRFANANKADHWEQQALDSLVSIGKQVDKTFERSKNDIDSMSRFLARADQAVERQKAMAARRDQLDGRLVAPDLLHPLPEATTVCEELLEADAGLDVLASSYHKIPAEVIEEDLMGFDLEGHDISTEERVSARPNPEMSLYTAWVKDGRGRSRISVPKPSPHVGNAIECVDAELAGESFEGNTTAAQNLRNIRVVRKQLIRARPLNREPNKGPPGQLLPPPEFPKLS